jgi:hypothetical protein
LPDTTAVDRARLIAELEATRGSRIISLVLGDRRGMETKIAGDLLPSVYDYLRTIGETKHIDLYLYTTGGDSLAGWALVNLIREHCERFGVIVPFRAMSCGTLMALGADELVLTAGSELSPVDPSVSSPYNPQVQVPQDEDGITFLPVSVEDLVGFIHLVKSEIGITSDEALGGVVEHLTEKVHPPPPGSGCGVSRSGAGRLSREETSGVPHPRPDPHRSDR